MALQGSYTITLKNADGTEHTINETNTVTNSAYNLINQTPMCLQGNIYLKTRSMFAPLKEIVFGGVLLFKNEITQDVNTIIPPSTALEVGHAGDPYSGTDTFRGTLNENESVWDAVNKTQKWVWDFATDRANGTIKSIGLTSRAGGNVGMANSIASNTDIRFSGAGASFPSYVYPYSPDNRLTATPTDFQPIGLFNNNEFIFVKSTAGTVTVTFQIKRALENVNLSTSYPYEITEKQVTTTKKLCSNEAFFTDGDKIYSIYAYSTNKIDYIVFNSKSLEVEYEDTFTIQDAKFSNTQTQTPAVYNGHLYIGSGNRSENNKLQYYKIKLDDITNYSMVELATISESGITTSVFNGWLIFIARRYNDNTEKYVSIFYNGEEQQTGYSLTGYYFRQFKIVNTNLIKPPYFLYYGTNNGENVFALGIFTPFLSTVHNFETSVVKNSTQTMKITYTIKEI